MFWNSVQSVISILLFLGFGFALSSRPWFGKSGELFLSKFCIQAAVPVYMACNIYDSVKNRAELIQIFGQIPIPFFMILFFLAEGWIAAYLLKIASDRRGAFINAMGFSNVVFIGFPVIQGILGDQAIPFGVSYYIANTTLFWTLGAYLLRRDSGQSETFHAGSVLRHLFPPPILGFLAGTVMILCGFSLPAWLYTVLQKMGGTAMPLGLVFVGSVLRGMNWKEMSLTKDVIFLLFNRFLIAPALLILLYPMIPAGILQKQTYLLLTIMPAMTQFGILARDCGADCEFASMLIAVTTIASIVVIPLYCSFMTTLF